MRLAKKLFDFTRLSDRGNVVLQQIVIITLLCFASVSVSSAADATFLRIPALGRTCQLGFLYDERTDEFRPISVFSKPPPHHVIIETMNPDVTTKIQDTNTYEEKIELLQIGLSAGVNILAGNTKVKGTAGLLLDSKDNLLVMQQSLLRTYHTIEEDLQVFYNDLRPLFNEHLLMQGQGDATHIVSGISWGSRIAVTLQTIATDGVDSAQLSDAFYEEFHKIIRGPMTRGKVGVGGNFNFSVDIKSDIILPDPVPMTVKDVAMFFNKFPELIYETNGGRGVPLEFSLTPLFELRSHSNVHIMNNLYVHKIKDSTLRSVTRIFDDMLYSQQRIESLYQKSYLQLHCLPPQSRFKISHLRTSFLNYKNKLTDVIKENIINVRSGFKPPSILREIGEEFKRGNFSSRNFKDKIKKHDNVMEKVAFCKMIQFLYSDIEYFSSSENLIIPRISANFKKPIYILFTKTEFTNLHPVHYTDLLNTFLTTLYVPGNKLFIVDCDGGHVFCNHLEGTEILEFKNGKLASPDFKYGGVDEGQGTNMEKRIVDLENNITMMHNLIVHLRNQLQYHMNGNQMDYCHSSPCLNNGICHSGMNSFSCACPSGFTGLTCNTNINKIEPIKNPYDKCGRCIDEIDGMTCVCPPSFEEAKCLENIEAYRFRNTNRKCQNGASCIDMCDYLNDVCSCSNKINGSLCEIDIDDCSSNSNERCQNGETCADGTNSFSCACEVEYEDQDCSFGKKNSDRNHLCISEGTCVNEVTSFSCVCVGVYDDKFFELANKCGYGYPGPGTEASPTDAAETEICDKCGDDYIQDLGDTTNYKFIKTNASLLVSSHTDIKLIPLDRLNQTIQIAEDVDNVEGTDYIFRSSTIFWFSYDDKKVYQAPKNGEHGKLCIMHDASSDILGLAVDWIYNNVYWVDYSKKQLCVSSLDGAMKKVLFSKGIQTPYSIAVNPLNGWMYWTDGDKDRIIRAGMDGSRRKVILHKNIKNPYGLVVDFVDNRLYWSQETNPSSIWSSNFDGSDKELIFTANPLQFESSYFWKIATFEEDVYFIDYWSRTIYKVNKRSGEELVMVYESESYLYDLKIYDATLQPDGENLCSKQIGHQCSHFCFPAPSVGNRSVSTTCACPDGLSLSADQLKCS